MVTVFTILFYMALWLLGFVVLVSVATVIAVAYFVRGPIDSEGLIDRQNWPPQGLRGERDHGLLDAAHNPTIIKRAGREAA